MAGMQKIADQSGCSHTAFVTELGQGSEEANIRFFTPGGEIKNCAHATIAAYYLRAIQPSAADAYSIKQRTLSGLQDVEIRHHQDVISVYFKQDAVTFSTVEPEITSQLLAALKLPAKSLDSRYPIVLASPGSNRFTVAVKDEVVMNALQPDIAKLKALCTHFDSIGCFVFVMESLPTTASNEVSKASAANARMFAPNIGVDEDIINGNSSGCLAAYLLRLNPSASEIDLSVRQGQNFNRLGTVMVNARRLGSQIETWVGGRAARVSQRQVHIESA